MADPPRVRLTTATRLVLDAILAGAADDLPWGYRICEESGLGSGTVYPLLERLEEARLIKGAWERGQPPDRPRRRFYTVTSTGRAWYAQELARREKRSPAWRPRPQGTL